MRVQLLQFGIVGVLGYGVDSGVLYAMLSLGLGFGTGRLVSFLCAVLTTWLLNRRFTFGPDADARPSSPETGNPLLREGLRYLAAMSFGGVLNVGTYAAVMAMFSYHAALPAIGVAAGSVVGMVANFASAKWWVYRRKRS